MCNRGSIPIFNIFIRCGVQNVMGLEIDEKWKCLKSANCV